VGGAHVAPKVSAPKVSAATAKVVADLKAGRVADTEHAHRVALPGGKLGPYSAERTRLHQQIVREMFAGKGVHLGSARAVFLAGGPASGKGGLLKNGHVEVPKDAVHIDPDTVKARLPEYQALKAAGDPNAASMAHEESSHVAKLAMNLALLGQHHIVVDSVGDSGPGKFAGKLKAAARAGHRVEVHYATTSVEEALQRAEARGRRTGRYVPEGFVRAAHRDVSARFADDVRGLRGVAVKVHDTSKPKTRLIASKSAMGVLRVHDATRYAQFMAKGSGGGG
jgi:predicted ABC-type ATPase